jgi:hypothetical protein
MQIVYLTDYLRFAMSRASPMPLHTFIFTFRATNSPRPVDLLGAIAATNTTRVKIKGLNTAAQVVVLGT